MITWIVAGLILLLPPDFKEVAGSTKTVSAVGPPGSVAKETYKTWADSAGRTLHVFWWEPSAPGPGGPMSVAEEWTENVNGETVKVFKTNMFFGSPQEVLAAYFKHAKPEAQILIYAKSMPRKEFGDLLRTVRFTDKQDPRRPDQQDHAPGSVKR